MQDYINNYKDEMANEYVIVKNSGANVTYYYTGRDKNPYLTNKTLKETIDSETTNNIKNVKVNGSQVNKVTGLKDNKTTMKNWVWYSGQLWQVMGDH